MKLKMKPTTKYILCMVILLSNTVVMFVTFMAAYFNGGSVVVTINSFGEAATELILLPLMMLFAVYCIVKLFRDSSKIPDM